MAVTMNLISLILLASVSLTTSTELPAGILPLRLAVGSFSPFYDVQVTLGNQTFQLVADTGSSDTWAVHSGYKCLDAASNAELPQEACEYSNTTYHASSTFEQITNQTFGAQFGLGIVLGTMAYEDVTLAGITVHRQPIGIADRVTLSGDGTDSGILGLGYPILTSAHPGTKQQPNDTLLLNKVPYDPVITRMYKQGSTAPWFSLALDRPPRNSTTGGPGGYFGLGALPPVKHSSVFAKAPVEITDAIPLAFTNDIRQITEWTLGIEAVTWGVRNGSLRATNTTRFQAVVDSGNYFNQIPQPMADEIHKAYNPPAVLDPLTSMYVVDCDAVTPILGFTIAGQTFYHLPEDLILKTVDGRCVSTILPPAGGVGDLSLNFLGDVFMQNVVSVFDFGINEMRFAARADGGGVVYGNSSTPVPSPTPGVSSSGIPLGSGGSVGKVLMLLAFLWMMVL